MWRVASNPIFFQVFPLSSDLYAPSPQEELCRLFGSPVPTPTTEGYDGAIALPPIVDTPSLSNTGSHVAPLFVVFHTPPDATPTNTMFGLPSTTAKSSMRPPIVAGPISRNSRFFSLSVGFGWSAGPANAATANTPQNAVATTAILKTDETRFIVISPCKARHHTACYPPRASNVSGRAHGPCVDRRVGYAQRFSCVRSYTSLPPHARLFDCFPWLDAPRESSSLCTEFLRAPALLPDGALFFTLLITGIGRASTADSLALRQGRHRRAFFHRTAAPPRRPLHRGRRRRHPLWNSAAARRPRRIQQQDVGVHCSRPCAIRLRKSASRGRRSPLQHQHRPRPLPQRPRHREDRAPPQSHPPAVRESSLLRGPRSGTPSRRCLPRS